MHGCEVCLLSFVEKAFALELIQYFYITNTSCASRLKVLANSKEVVAPALTALNFLPTIARYVDNTHSHGVAPAWLLGCPSLHLIDIDILIPIVSAWGNNTHDVLGDKFCSKPARPGPADGTENQPTAGLDMRHAICQERSGMGDVLDNLEYGQDIDTLLWCRW